MDEQTRKALELAKAAIFRMDIFGNEEEAIAAIDAALATPAAPVAQPLMGSAAHIKTATTRLEAAMNCHPNAVQALISEAWDELNEAHGIGQRGA